MVAFFQRLFFLSALISLTLTLIVTSATPLWAITIDGRLDRNPVALNESFTLTYSANDAPDGNPDFAPLERDFELLNQNQNSQISIVNGSYEKKTEWVLTLMGKRAGRLTIPPINFGTDRSRGLTIDIVSTTGATDTTGRISDRRQIELHVELDKHQLKVQEQLILTVRLLRSVNLTAAALTEPEVLDLDCLVHKLGNDHDYEKRIDNVRYLVTERRYALFPQQSGTLRIAPLTFEGRVADRRSNRFDPFGQSGRVVRQRSDEQSIVVNAAPVPPGTTWLPGHSVELSESWSSDPLSLTVGEPVTRTITLRVSGQSAALLPPLEIPTETDIKRYPDQPTLADQVDSNGLIGIRTEKYALVPTREGRLRLPPIEVNWWDTTTNQSRTARLPGRDLEAVAAPVTTVQPSSPAAGTPHSATVMPGTTSSSGIEDRLLPWRWWSLLCAFLVIGWLFTIAVSFNRRPRNAAARGTKDTRSQSTAKHLKDVIVSGNNNDPIATQRALLAWGRLHFELGEHANLGRIADACPAPLKEHIRQLQAHIYGNRDSAWCGKELCQELNQQSLMSKRSTGSTAIKPLPDLYPE